MQWENPTLYILSPRVSFNYCSDIASFLLEFHIINSGLPFVRTDYPSSVRIQDKLSIGVKVTYSSLSKDFKEPTNS